jgi:integrase
MKTDKSASKTASGKGKSSKLDINHWRKAITQPGGSGNWMATFCHAGHRESLGLKTDQKEAAAFRALDSFLFLKKNDWEAWREEYKPQSIKPEPKSGVTVGQYISAVQARFSDTQAKVRSYEQYCVCLRRVAAWIGKVPKRGRIDRGMLGHVAWRAKVEAVELSLFTDAAINQWQHDFIKRAKAIDKGHAKVSVNTVLRQCQALFHKGVLAKLKDVVTLDFVPFQNFQFEKRPNLKYDRAAFPNSHQLAAAAIQELPVELYKIFLLALRFGLRRNEIDLLEWKSFVFEPSELSKFGLLKIQKTEFFEPKTKESAANLPLDEGFAKAFKEFKAKAKGRFVIESKGQPKPDSIHYELRAEKEFAELNKWLRKHGVTGHKPLHQLRKEMGSMMNEVYGIHAASTALRHSNIATTAAYYVADNPRVLPDCGFMLKVEESNIIPMTA